jgi:hypothetical protein
VQKLDVPLDQATTKSLEALKAFGIAWARQVERVRAQGASGGGALLTQSLYEFGVGNVELARSLFKEGRALMNTAAILGNPLTVAVASAAGDFTLAGEAAKSRLAEFPDSLLWRDWYGPQDQAIIALARRDPAAVLALTEKIRPRNHPNSVVPLLRGEAQLQLGNGLAAAAEFQELIDSPAVFGDHQHAARIGQARAYAMAGEKPNTRN